MCSALSCIYWCPTTASTRGRHGSWGTRAWPPVYCSQLCLFCVVFRVYDGAPPQLLQEDLMVPGAQEESGFQGSVLFMFRSQLYAMYIMVHHPGLYKRTS